ncbi:MAG TPA: AAA family ATPase, partial [Acidimicrobiales bacterium]
HVSVLFFLGDRAYKLKKPVAFPFVDLTTREAREQICRREVELNRRLAPDVYLGVIDVSGPDGEPCDHLVVMRRMPADRRLSALVAAGDESAGDAVDQLGELIAGFHRGASRSPTIDRAGSADAVTGLWHENFAELRPFAGVVQEGTEREGAKPGAMLDGAELSRAEHLADRFLAGRRPLLEARIAEGAICDGHGDLLADDVFCLPDGPRVLDCIEFDDELRFGDVANDLAFLVMDLDRLGAAHLAARLVRRYEATAGVVLPAGLLRFYVAYRAQVRAKIACLRADQHEAGSSERAAAVAEARLLLARCVEGLEAAAVRLVLVGGLPGTGKSTLARELGDRLGAEVLRSDVVRKELAGLSPDESGAAAFGAGLYAPAMTDRVYAELAARAAEALAQGRSVVVDASFVSDPQRRALRALADAADVVELCCVLDPGEAARRIERRRAEGGDPSDADTQVARALAAMVDPWPGSLTVSTAAAPPDVVDEVLRRLPRPGLTG